MSLAKWIDLGRKAVHRPPGYVIRRIGRELKHQVERPWCRIRPHLLTERALLRRTNAPNIDALWTSRARMPFFVSPDGQEEYARRFLETFPDAKGEIIEAAERILRHEFDLLGSGPVVLGPSLPWHMDFKTGRQWPLRYCRSIDYYELDRPSDVKVPWELSRHQHFATLGQAYWLTGDERFAEEFVAQVSDWIRANPLARGVNWACTMDVALRAISWIWGFFFLGGSEACRRTEFRRLFLVNLYLHGEYVANHIEVGDVNGNHYLIDAVGLVFLGAFFDSCRQGRKWLDRGRRMLYEEIFAQVSDDGVDFEQSVAYHRLVLEAFLAGLLLLRVRQERIPDDVWRRLERMHEFVCAYIKPGGRAPLIGDDDSGRIHKLGFQVSNDHRYLLATGAVLFGRGDFKRAAGRLWEETFWLLGPEAVERFVDLADGVASFPSMAFPAGGFYVMRASTTHLIIDCGAVGTRGLGGHGHNDILSFELCLNGMNIVTDCGSFLYTASRDWRNRFRGTAFHNTIQVDDQELNRLIHPDDLWRLHYDAVPTAAEWRSTEMVDYFRGGHRGYARLREPVTVQREVALEKRSERVVFGDSVDGVAVHRLTWRFHLDPAIIPEETGHGVRLMADGREAWFLPLASPPGLSVALEPGWVSPHYGVKVPTTVMVARVESSTPVRFVYAFADRSLGPSDAAPLAALLSGR